MNTQEMQPDEALLLDLAVRFVLAMKRSIPKDSIAPEFLWPRIASALETSASVAESWHQMVSKMAQKLGASSPHKATSKELNLVCSDLGDHFEQFRYLCERDTFYVVAIAQAQSTENFERRKKNKSSRKASEDIIFDEV